jgi:hypothetical protein
MIKEPDYTVIRISRKNYESLRLLGHTPETFDDIISKVLKENGCDASVVTTDGEEAKR